MAVKLADDCKEIVAQYDDATEFDLDPKGYFLIRILDGKIEVGFCETPNEVRYLVRGTTPIEIYQTVLREKIITRADHAAYLGRELQKAYTALTQKLEYIQDSPLDFSKTVK